LARQRRFLKNHQFRHDPDVAETRISLAEMHLIFVLFLSRSKTMQSGKLYIWVHSFWDKPAGWYAFVARISVQQ
jgi:hypothetical protein